MEAMQSNSLEFLRKKATWVRKTTLEMIAEAGSGHPGGSLSEAEILVALYYDVMNIEPKDPTWEKRDRFILSKGHCCPPLYAILADKGYFPKEELSKLRKFGSLLQGHPSIITPGIETVSGSLGNGLSIGVGMAMSGRKRGLDYRVYVLLGDGELQEGSNWEAAMSAAHHKLSNMTAIVDYNKIQINGWTNDIVQLEPLEEKWAAFGWNVLRVDGHDMEQVVNALRTPGPKDKPTVIIADTIKGKGVSFMENECGWHGGCPTKEQLAVALAELEEVDA